MKYNETELKFKEMWIDKVMESLNKSDEETRNKMSEWFDNRYIPSDIEIENTQDANTTKVDGTKFFFTAKEKFILNESGTLTWKHKLKTSINTPLIIAYIKIRQIKKKAKVKAAEIGDMIKHSILSNEEYNLKIIINGLTYGPCPI